MNHSVACFILSTVACLSCAGSASPRANVGGPPSRALAIPAAAPGTASGGTATARTDERPPAGASEPAGSATVTPPPVDAPLVSAGEASLALRGLRRVEHDFAPASPDWSRTFAAFYMLAATADGRLALVQPGAKLRTGEQIEFQVRVAHPAYVHLILLTNDGGATLLYPVDGEPERMEPGQWYRVPGKAGTRFELDAHTGTERVAFVVTDKPLEAQDAALRDLVQQARAAGAWSPSPAAPAAKSPRTGATASPRAAEDPHPGPELGAGATRGLIRSSGTSGRALDVALDPTGVAVANFSFEHMP
jgi:hypothetical protein